MPGGGKRRVEMAIEFNNSGGGDDLIKARLVEEHDALWHVKMAKKKGSQGVLKSQDPAINYNPCSKGIPMPQSNRVMIFRTCAYFEAIMGGTLP